MLNTAFYMNWRRQTQKPSTKMDRQKCSGSINRTGHHRPTAVGEIGDEFAAVTGDMVAVASGSGYPELTV